MLLREARGPRSMAEIAARSGVPAETLRKIETGRIATPAFFTVAALAGALGLSLENWPAGARNRPPRSAPETWFPLGSASRGGLRGQDVHLDAVGPADELAQGPRGGGHPPYGPAPSR